MSAAQPADDIIRAMQPGRIASEGFLGSDRRSLADIRRADASAVQRLGLSHQRIARRMREFRDAGQKGQGNWVPIPPDWEARADAARGELPCPFEDAGLFQKTVITVRNIRHGTEITYSDLSMHLIEQHGFYEGRGSAFRLEPERIAATLGLG